MAHFSHVVHIGDTVVLQAIWAPGQDVNVSVLQGADAISALCSTFIDHCQFVIVCEHYLN